MQLANAQVQDMPFVTQIILRAELGLFFCSSFSAVPTVRQCVVDGTVTYQSVPCEQQGCSR
jgi:hypothetical protein